MLRLVVVESNTAATSSKILARGAIPLGPQFAATLAEIYPALCIDIVSPYEGDTAPLEGADGIVFTGSGEDWSTDDPRAAPLIRVMEAAFNKGVPAYGSCNGLNLAAVVLGGAVGHAPNGYELGLARDVQLTSAGRAHPMMAGRSAAFAVPCIHRDEVTRLPEGADLLASNTHTTVQAMAYDHGGVSFWGTQYHPEYRPSDVARTMMARGLGEDASNNDLDLAETSDAAAGRWGATRAELAPARRTTELRNWLTHVDRIRAGRPSCFGWRAPELR